MNRRTFLANSAITGLGLTLSAGLPSGRRSHRNNRLNVAVMGVFSRGAALARGFAAHPDAHVLYICDVDEKAIQNGLDAVKSGGQTAAAKGIVDFRRALEDPDLDALVVATPVHWHVPASILALKAGKHVYLEKPCSHNLHEGLLLVEASRRYNRVVQMGNQRRSWPGVIEGIELLHDGILGNTYFARCWYANNRPSIGIGSIAAIPSHLDYELWQGPAPRREYKDNLIHYNWHWFWHWGAGELLNNGTHFIDLARWGLDVDYPIRVNSSGGRYHYKDDQQTPDTHMVSFDFPEGKTITWEGRSCNPRPIEGSSSGVSFHGERGTMIIDGNSYVLYDNDQKEVQRSATEPGRVGLSGPGFNMDRDHITNFIEAVRDGIVPRTEIADANITVHSCHLGNIAQRIGRTVQCDPKTGLISNDPEAMKFWRREYEPGWEPTL